jgi:dihydroorotate dehydrogenase
MYQIIKNTLFKKPPEEAHYWTMSQLRKAYNVRFIRNILKKKFSSQRTDLEQTIWGITFKNPVGLAAGFDKDAKFINELDMLGFGFIEIGTLTPKAQDGNPPPRLFRLPQDEALINRMGFNNEGVDAAVQRLKNTHSNIIIGGNIGKNKITPNEQADDDYIYCFHALYDVVDYFTVNVSSPNTPNLRALQDKEPLEKLLRNLVQLNLQKGKPKPILLKIAPDLNNDQLDDIITIVKNTKIDGIVATNTTIAREGLLTPSDTVTSIGMGGLSGKPVKNRSTEVVRYLHQNSNGSIPIVAVGGIQTAADAQEKLDAGACLVQVYTGFIYEGPYIVKNICDGIQLPIKHMN